MINRESFIIKLDKNFYYKLLLMVIFCQYTLFDFFRVIILKLPFISGLNVLFFPILYITLILKSYNKAMVTIRKGDLLFIFSIFIAFMFTFIVYPQNVDYIVEHINELLPCIPFFLLGLSFQIDEDINRCISKCCCVAIIASWIYALYFTRSTGSSEYHMTWSYYILPNVMIVLDYAWRNKRTIYWCFFCSGFLYVLAMGTRGPIVILFTFILVEMWINSKKRTATKILMSVILFSLVFLFTNSSIYLQSVTFCAHMLESMGMSTRITDFLTTNNIISYTSGRDLIYESLINKLKERPMMGYGIYGEWTLGFYSAHNMYLEILYHFGLPIGILLLVLGVRLYIKGLLADYGSILSRWIIIYGCLVFVRGLFGGSYLSTEVFFVIGLCLKSVRGQCWSDNTKYATDKWRSI